MGGQGLPDDRQLYVARLLCIGALRAYARRHGVADVETLVAKYEAPSRGLEQGTHAIVLDTAADARKAIATGFDPFGSVEERTRGNPSGLLALWFNGRNVSGGRPAARAWTAVFPVRYKEFDAGWVEDAVNPNLQKIVMLMTCSMNGGIDRYDIERWAGKNRVDSTDNNLARATGTPVMGQVGASGVLDPIGNPAGSNVKQFLESTLPFEKVITSDVTTRRLRGPNDPAPGDTTPFVTDQSYETVNRSTPPVLGEFRPSPQNELDTASYVRQLDSPDDSKLARQGSGGNYLSNEIFYRTALRRDTERPRSGRATSTSRPSSCRPNRTLKSASGRGS